MLGMKQYTVISRYVAEFLLECYSLMTNMLCCSIAKKVDSVPVLEPMNCETNEGLSCLDSY